MIRRHNTRARVTAACICLLAVALLYAPVAVAVWAAQTMACCTGDHCPIAAHHHKSAPAEPAHEMDCGHDMGSLMACKISCCNTTERSMVTPLIFVLPHLSFGTTNFSITRVAETLRPIEVPRSVEPLSPPPEFRNAAL
jgi:hypothetical protein